MSGQAQAAHHHPRLQAHFEDMGKQAHAARLGMWIFLGTEILLFAGLFVCYAYYRSVYGQAFELASHHLSKTLGTIETFDLITSSLFAAMALEFIHKGKKNLATLCLVITVLLGLAFLGIHGYEYWNDFKEGTLPGQYYHFEALHMRGAALFYTVYFLMTGLHAIHVTIGAGVLAVLGYRTWRGEYSLAYDNPVELGAMYWHLVDLIWIFLYPLLYLL